MLKTRSFAMVAAALLLSLHGSVLAVWNGSETASLWGDWIVTAAALTAAVMCWQVSRQAGPFGQRVWRLVGLSALLGAASQALYTIEYHHRHAPFGTLWPSDFLAFFCLVPVVMTLFLSPGDSRHGFRWLRVCDFVQVCSLVLALELSQIYVPSRWQVSGRAMEVRALQVGIFFFGLIVVSFFARGLLCKSRPARTFFLRMGGLMAVYGVALNSNLYSLALGHYRLWGGRGLFWTFAFCLQSAIAVTWDESGQEPATEERSRGLRLLAQFSPLLIPAIVFPLLLRVAQEQFWWAVILVMVSFAAAGGRLLVLQTQLLVNSRELEKNLSLLQGIMEGTTDSVFVKDLEGRYLMINRAGAGLLGRRVEEVIGKTDEEVFVPEVGRAIMERDRRVLQSGETQTYEEFGTAAGVTRLYLATKGPFRDSGGKVIGLLGISRDITLRRRAEEEVRQSQQKLRMHIEHTPLAVVEWDLEFRVAAWNPSAERIFGYSREEAIGQHSHFIVPAQSRQQVEKVWRQLLAQKGGSWNVNENLTKSGRTITCEWYNTPLVDEAGRVLGVASFVQDVSERIALEDRFRQAQKMEAIGRLAGGIAHDFNNLLTVVLGYTQILSDGLPAGRLAEATGQIKSAADRATGITRQLLAFSRKQVLSPRIIDLNDIMLNLDSLLRRLIGEDIEVLTVPASGLGAVKADPGQVEQVIMNLALNARDAMPHGGKLTLETANTDLDEAYARDHPPLEPGRYVMLAVSDTGVGMTPEVRVRIFEPFFTTKEVGKGTGLGLSTVYGIVKQSGGYIWVYSEPGRGTSFKIYFPRVEQPAQTPGVEKRPASAQRGSETILLVEDDPQLRALAASVLSQCGYKVLAAAGPEEGLELSRANHRDIRLLITDVVMPRMNGRQLAEQVLQIASNARVLYISGYTNDAIVHYGVLDEGLWFLPKPFTLAALLGKVREVLDASPDGTQGAGEE
jgi:two-component system cell cycle sensor histidine kinase/response regulator CckA